MGHGRVSVAMSFSSWLDFGGETAASETPKSAKPRKARSKVSVDRGCEHCPLNSVPGVHKIKGSMRGKALLLLAQSPGPEENRHLPPTELVGPAGQWLWEEMDRVGLSRDDFDIQNAVRCFPADYQQGSYRSNLVMRNPSPAEIRCCSVYTEEALAQNNAKQILVFGQIAAKQLLGSRTLPSTKIFWSDKLQAKVYLIDHPAFFLRGYGSGGRLEQFRKTLEQVVHDRAAMQQTQDNLSDEYAYLRKQDYRLVLTEDEALAAEKIIRKYKKWRISFDIESDQFEDGYHVFACGFAPKPGLSFVFVFRHVDQGKADGKKVLAVAKRLLEDGEIIKCAHYGYSDVTALADYEDIHVRGFDDGEGHDTNMSEFLRFSDQHAYGLDAIAERRFPEFSGYKHIRIPEVMAAAAEEWQRENPDKKLPAVFTGGNLEAQDKYVEKFRLLHLRYLSLETLRLYNGADCHLCKAIEVSNKNHVPQALMNLYIDVSYILAWMEPQGPLFDYDQCGKLEILFPYQEAVLRRRIQKMVGDPKFNPGSPDQVYDYLYRVLQLDYPGDGKPNTRKGTLMMLAADGCKFAKLMLEWRPASKEVGILTGYKRSADAHEGRLRTRWWITGARTGRLSSGGSKDRTTGTLVNLQNIKKSELVKNLLVADSRWREFYNAAKKIQRGLSVKGLDDSAIETALVEWVESKLPDLGTYLIQDYGQVEVRLLAQITGDKNLIKDCQESDIHTKVGVEMTGWDADAIRNDERTRTLTKNVHFGIIFGLSKEGVYKFVLVMSPPEQRGKITREEVYAAYDRYFKRYPGVAKYRDEMRAFAKENKFVRTIFGMIQTLNVTDDGGREDDTIEEMNADEGGGGRRAWWGNQCINGPVQGSAHQLVLCGLVNLKRRREEYEMLGIPRMEVHDNLVFRVRVLDLIVAYKKAKFLMECESLNVVKSDFPDIVWKVPIVVDAKAGLRMGAVVKVNEKTTVGGFLLAWLRECIKQERRLGQLLLACNEPRQLDLKVR